jgi:uncharacterized protein YfiM (DUF2279 family)
VAECVCLENRSWATNRGFESLLFRQFTGISSMGYVVPGYQIVFVNGIGHSRPGATDYIEALASGAERHGVTADRVQLVYNSAMASSAAQAIGADGVSYDRQCTRQLRDLVGQNIGAGVETCLLAHGTGADIALRAIEQLVVQGGTTAEGVRRLLTVRTYCGSVLMPSVWGRDVVNVVDHPSQVKEGFQTRTREAWWDPCKNTPGFSGHLKGAVEDIGTFMVHFRERCQRERLEYAKAHPNRAFRTGLVLGGISLAVYALASLFTHATQSATGKDEM